MAISEENKLKLDNIVTQMEANKEPTENIQMVVDDFKSKYDVQEIKREPLLSRVEQQFRSGYEKTGRDIEELALGKRPAPTPEELQRAQTEPTNLLEQGAYLTGEWLAPRAEFAGLPAGAITAGTQAITKLPKVTAISQALVNKSKPVLDAIGKFTKQSAGFVGEVFSGIPRETIERTLTKEVSGQKVLNKKHNPANYEKLGKNAQEAVNYVQKQAGKQISEENKLIKEQVKEVDTAPLLAKIDNLIAEQEYDGLSTLKKEDFDEILRIRKLLEPNANITELQKAKSTGKSFDDYLASLGNPFYHGTSEVNQESVEKFGLDIAKNMKGRAEAPYAGFTTKSKEYANFYGNNKYEPVELYQTEPLNILDQGSKKWAETMGKSESIEDSTKIAEKLRKEGYDIIDGGNEQVILNPKKFKTKTQLMNEWESPQEKYMPTTSKLLGVRKILDNELTYDPQRVKKTSGVGEKILKDIRGEIKTTLETEHPELAEINARYSQIANIKDRLLTKLKDENVARNLKNISTKDETTQSLFRELDALAPDKYKFMDELDDEITREAFSKLFPGKGGGSGSPEGYGNILRVVGLSSVNPLLLPLTSPRSQKALIRGVGTTADVGRFLQEPTKQLLSKTAEVTSEKVLPRATTKTLIRRREK